VCSELRFEFVGGWVNLCEVFHLVFFNQILVLVVYILYSFMIFVGEVFLQDVEVVCSKE
jgi:hypothetical protein